MPDIKALDRALSDIDHPHAVSISYVYHLPKLQNGNSFLKAVLNDWRTSGLIQHHSGEALTAYMGTDNSLTGLARIVRNAISANRLTRGRTAVRAIVRLANPASIG